jgi:hypothetical protein
MASEESIERRPDRFDLNAHFRIDRGIRDRWKAGGVSRFSELDDAVKFGRYALDHATRSAIVEGDRRNFSRYLRDWKRARELSHSAKTTLSSFLVWLSTPGGDGRSRVHLRQMRRLEGTPASTLNAQAARDVRALREVEDILNRFETFATQGARRLPEELTNPGDPAKVEFVFRLAETWLVLTGKIPSPNKTLEANPFLRFARDGWLDVGGRAEDDSFAQSALHRAIVRLKQIPQNERATFRPDWWTKATGSADPR